MKKLLALLILCPSFSFAVGVNLDASSENLDTSSVTKQGNTFNGVSQLVRTNTNGGIESTGTLSGITGTFLAGTTNQIRLEGNLGHIVVARPGTSPTVASCGGGSPSVVGSDTTGRMTIGTGGTANTCVARFLGTWKVAPVCVCNNETQVLVTRATSTVTDMTCSVAISFGAGDIVSYHCFGY